MNRLRRFVRNSPLRHLLLNRWVRPVLGWLVGLRFIRAAWIVDRPWSFLVADLRRVGQREYRIRSTGVPLVVRHGQGALEVLDDIFVRNCYAPPPALESLIGAAPRILDVGANVGMFAAFARGRWPDATIEAIEADPANVAALRRLGASDGSGQVKVSAAAATVSDGPVRFRSGLGTGSMLDDAGELVDGVDLLVKMHEADFMKLDIERGEWPILEDPRLAEGGPIVLVMEYHRRFVDDWEAAALVRAHLLGAGFEVGYERPNYWGHGLIWAWRR